MNDALHPLPDTVLALKQVFGDACDAVRVEGDEPLLLDDPAYCYVTQGENHQLFCVGWRDGSAVGRRDYVTAVGSGQLLFAQAPNPDREDEPTVFLLGAPPGSHVLRIPTRLFIEAMADPERRAAVEQAFDSWIALLVSMLPSAPVPTRCDTVVAGLTLGPSTVPLRARAGIVWITLAHSPSRYGGVRVSEHDDSAPRQWPLTETTWVVGGIAGAPN